MKKRVLQLIEGADFLNIKSMMSYLFPLLFIIFSLLLIVGSVYTPTPFGAGGQVISGNNYSIALSIVLIVTSIIQIFKIKRTKEIAGKKLHPEALKKLIQTIITIFFFILGFTFLGFYTTTVITVFVMGMIMNDWDKKKIVPSLIFSLVLTVVFYFLFDIINIYLPDTWLI